MSNVIGLFSTKGGVGKTLLATNLAVAFGLGCHMKTILVDLNNGNGTADHLLKLTPKRTWTDLLSVMPEITSKQIELVSTSYRPGLDLLASPRELGVAEDLSTENLSLLISALKKRYEFIVLDTPNVFNHVVVGSLGLANLKIFILTPDLPCLETASRFFNLNKELSGLVINQYSTASALTPDEIKDHLDSLLLGVFPVDHAGVWANISYGESCVLRRNSKLGKSIRRFSTCLLRMIE